MVNVNLLHSSVYLFIICICEMVNTQILLDKLPFKKTSVEVPDSVLGHDRVVVCYISSWATYRPGHGAFHLDHIDPKLCTHLVYAFAGLDIKNNKLKSLDPYNDLEEDYGKGTYKKMTALKHQNPHLKITLAIGGWNEGSVNYSLLASSLERRNVFVQSAVDFIRKYNFDGLDLDWEFPGKRGGKPEDKVNFVLLVKELRQEFDKEGWILTAALGAGIDTMEVAYDVKALGQYLDLLHIMCYDYHGSWDRKTGSNTPLHLQEDKFSVEDSISYLVKMGAPRKKLILGLSMYGRTFIMEGEDNKDAQVLGLPAQEKGFQGPYTREDGFLGYNEICLELGKVNSTWKQYWDDNTNTPYAIQGNKVISYDNPRSITEKVKYAVDIDLGGLMIWALDNDDFHGDCDKKQKITYPLLRTINKAVAQAIEDKENEIDHKKKNSASAMAVSFLAASLTCITILLAL